MTDSIVPDWFTEAFTDVAEDLFHDLETESDLDKVQAALDRRARQLWFAVVANQPSVSTAVDVVPSPRSPLRERMGQTLTDLQGDGVTATARFGMPEAFDQFDPVAAGPWGQLDDALRRPPSTPRDVGSVVRPYAQGMYVTREAADLSVPKLECPACGGEGDVEIYEPTGQIHDRGRCRMCGGYGEVPAPVAPPSETGAVPEDSPVAQPLTPEELAAVEAEQAPPEVVAAQVAMAQAALNRMKER